MISPLRLALLGAGTCIAVVVCLTIWNPPLHRTTPAPVTFVTTTIVAFVEEPTPLPCTIDRSSASVLSPNSEQGQLLHIAHTLGLTPEGVAGTNTKEAFLHSYEQGFRLFEADFLWTADDHILVAHDKHEGFWGIATPFTSTTYDAVAQARYMDVYTPLDLQSFLELLQNYPDTYVILDIKFDTAERFDTVFEQIMTTATEILGKENAYRRLIPQLYTPEDIVRNPNFCLFTDILFTQYRNNLPWEAVLTFLRSYPSITAIATPYPHRFRESYKTDLDALHRGLYVHPVREETLQEALVSSGVGVFTTVSTTLTH